MLIMYLQYGSDTNLIKDPRNLRHRMIGGALLPSGPEALPPTTLAQGWGR